MGPNQANNRSLRPAFLPRNEITSQACPNPEETSAFVHPDSFVAEATKPIRVAFDPLVLKKHLKAGDIITVQTASEQGPAPKKWIDRVIVGAQRVSNLWVRGEIPKLADASVHVALYIGEGLIAESVPTGTLISTLEEGDWVLSSTDPVRYKIVRMRNQECARNAAKIAAHFVSECKDSENQYSFHYAIQSLIHDSSFGSNAQIKLFLAYAHHKNTGTLPLPSKGRRQFFCSYFVSWILQAAEAQERISELIDKHPELALPRPGPRQLAQLKEWAKMMATNHSHIVDDIAMKCDPKHLTPRKFQALIAQNPHHFEEIMIVVPP